MSDEPTPATDEPTPAPAAPAAPPASPEEQTADLKRLFERLVPPDGATIEDVNGNAYTLPSRLPARRQIRVIRVIERLREIATDATNDERIGDALSLVQGAEGIGLVAALANAALVFASNEEIGELVAEAFDEAFPTVVSLARQRIPAEYEEEREKSTALDLFAMEEIIAGLLPFSLRLLKRTSGAIQAFQATA